MQIRLLLTGFIAVDLEIVPLVSRGAADQGRLSRPMFQIQTKDRWSTQIPEGQFAAAHKRPDHVFCLQHQAAAVTADPASTERGSQNAQIDILLQAARRSTRYQYPSDKRYG